MSNSTKRARELTELYLEQAAAGMPGTPYSHLRRNEIISLAEEYYNTSALDSLIGSREVRKIKAAAKSRGTNDNEQLRARLLQKQDSILTYGGHDPFEIQELKTAAYTGSLTSDDLSRINELPLADRKEVNDVIDNVRKNGIIEIPGHQIRGGLDPRNPEHVARYVVEISDSMHSGWNDDIVLFKWHKAGYVKDLREVGKSYGYRSEVDKIKSGVVSDTALTLATLGGGRAFSAMRPAGKVAPVTRSSSITKPEHLRVTSDGLMNMTRRGTMSPKPPAAKPVSPKPVPSSTTPRTRQNKGILTPRRMAEYGAAGMMYEGEVLEQAAGDDTFIDWPDTMDDMWAKLDSLPEDVKNMGLSIVAGAAAGILGSGIAASGLRKLVSGPVTGVKKILSSARLKSSVEHRSSVEGAREVYESQVFTGEKDFASLAGDVTKADSDDSGLGALSKIVPGLLGGIGTLLTRVLNPVKSAFVAFGKWLRPIIKGIINILGFKSIMDASRLPPGTPGRKPPTRFGRGRWGMLIAAALAGVTLYASHNSEDGTLSLDNLSDSVLSSIDSMSERLGSLFGSPDDANSFQSTESGIITSFSSNAPVVSDLGKGKSFESQAANKQKFLKEFGPLATIAARELGVDPRIIIAQAAIETGWGKHLAGGNNYFGIKTHGWKGKSSGPVVTREFENTWIKDSFRNYDSAEQSALDYVLFLRTNPRYKKALDIAKSGDSAGYISAIHKAGYATDPNYASKIINIAKGLPSTGFSAPPAPTPVDADTSSESVASNTSGAVSADTSSKPLVATNTTVSSNDDRSTSTVDTRNTGNQHRSAAVQPTSTEKVANAPIRTPPINISSDDAVDSANKTPMFSPSLAALIKKKNRHFHT